MITPFIIAAKKVNEKRETKSKDAYEKQAKNAGETLNAIDRVVTGERPVQTATKAVCGNLSEHIATPQEKENMTAAQRLKGGETARHVALEKFHRRQVRKEAQGYEQQENGKTLTARNRIRIGERPLRAVYKVNSTGKSRDCIPTKSQRREMTLRQRNKSGEAVRHVMKER